jgi:hypothetical protein
MIRMCVLLVDACCIQATQHILTMIGLRCLYTKNDTRTVLAGVRTIHTTRVIHILAMRASQSTRLARGRACARQCYVKGVTVRTGIARADAGALPLTPLAWLAARGGAASSK